MSSSIESKRRRSRRAKKLLGGGLAGIALAGGAVAAAGWYFSAPRYRGPASDHFDGERFLNLRPTRHESTFDFLKWMANRNPGQWETWREIRPAKNLDERVSGSELRITFVNHATLLIQTENLNILTDPIWSDRCSPVANAGPKRHHAPGIRFDDLPPIDYVLVSHNHYDHLDVPTLRRLAFRFQPRIFVGLGNSGVVKGATELDWWDSAELARGVRVHAVPAQHFSSRGMFDRDANLWCGYVIETPAGAIYFAGDTGWGPHFEMIRERFGAPRVAMLPIGAFRPEWFMCRVHISPRDAVRAASVLGARVSIPMHYGTFNLGDDGQDEPLEELHRWREPGVKFEVLPPGRTLRL